MEFLLPVALKLFPTMLPSTFEDKYSAVRHPARPRVAHVLTCRAGGEGAQAAPRQA
jgi:hypothetical protein